MSLSRRRFICISAAAMIAPVNSIAAHKLVRWKGSALGASASLSISGLSETEARILIGKAKDEIRRLEKIFSLYLPHSDINLLNKSGRIEAAPFELAQLFTQVAIIHSASKGAFDPTIQPLWQAYANANGKPDHVKIEKIRKTIGWHLLQFDENSARFTRPDMAITLNGIAQGYITDKIADLLKSNGLKNVLVSVGEIAAIGERSPGIQWKIGISEKQNGVVEEFLQLSNLAIATSAPLGTQLSGDGKTGHIIDPRNGKLPQHWQRISVIHKSAAMADGLSTAFAVMKRNEISRTIKQFDGTKLIAVDSDGRRFMLG